MDQLKYHVVFNLSKIDFSTISDSSFTFSTKTGDQPSVELDRITYMSFDSKRNGIPAELSVKFVNKTDGKAFNLSSSDFSVNRDDSEIDHQSEHE